jgi:hypothetical protein
MELTDYDKRWKAMLAQIGIASKRDWVKVAKPGVHISNTTVLYQGVERLVLGVSAEKCEPGSLFVEFKRLPVGRPAKVRHSVDTKMALEAIARVMARDPTFKPTAIPTKVWIAKLCSLARKGYLRGKKVNRTRFNIDWLEVKGLTKLDPALASAAHAAAIRFNNNTTLGMPVWPVKAWVAKPVPGEFISQEGLDIARKFFAAGFAASGEGKNGECWTSSTSPEKDINDTFAHVLGNFKSGKDITDGLTISTGEPNVEP